MSHNIPPSLSRWPRSVATPPLLCLLIFVTVAWRTPARLAVTTLRCEYLRGPAIIDVQRPRLSWQLVSNVPGIRQAAYRILVASSKDQLERNIGDQWDSGRVASDRSVQVPYAGGPLASRQRYWWKVRVWDAQNRASSWSDAATWEMALAPADWQAKWIGTNQTDTPAISKRNPAFYFRKAFRLDDTFTRARAYVSGLGYYELYVNGHRVGDHMLAPNHTNYDRRQSTDLHEPRVGNMSTRVLYETHDIARYLHSGANVVAICLGNGWYFQNERAEDIPFSYDTPRFIVQLEVDETNGRKKLVTSDDGWKISLGPIVHNGVYSGEIYDARLEMPGWNNVGFDDRGWRHAHLVRPPEGRLTAQMAPPDRVIKAIKPVTVTKRDGGVVRYDFGQVFSGWVRLSVSGRRGDTIRLRFVEDSGATYGQTDTYILNGGGPEVWQPRFTWHAFRYVDVIDPPFPMTLDNMEGRVVNTDIATAGSFACTNRLFNRILRNYRWTQPGNMHGGVPSDCPHRERRGYTGDGQISAVAAIYNFDMAAFYTKWLNDIADAQNSDTGYVPNTAPYEGGGGGVAWGSAYVIIPWNMYLHYADRRILQRHYVGMTQWIGYLESQRDAHGMIIEPGLGVWVPPEETKVPPALVSTAYFYHDLTLMAKIARVLGKTQDAARFTTLADHTKKAFHQHYYHADTKSYSIGYQGANVFPLGFHMVPEDVKEDVFRSLVRNIQQRAHGHFDTGMMATPLLLDVLTEYGRVDLAYTLMNQRDYPSFGYEIDNGATTIWETWLGDASHSHPMFGSVCAWFYQALAGIYPDPAVPGFKHILIHPHPVGGLKSARAGYRSVYGQIQSDWELGDNTFHLRLSIPPNTTATVYLPARDRSSIQVDGAADFVALQDHSAEFRIESGRCAFHSKHIGDLVRTPGLVPPTISPHDRLAFLPDVVTVRISAENPDAVIRYTRDGSEPTPQSPLYSGPFVIHHSRVIKAKAFGGNHRSSPTARSVISFADPAVNGLRYDYFEGHWRKLPAFAALKPLQSGIAYTVDLESVPTPTDTFGVVFSGTIDIATAGVYTFYLVSNDGSRLAIDGARVIDNDGEHGAVEKSGRVHLTAGRHSIKIDFFQAGGGLHLQFYVRGPGLKKQRVPASMLFRQ